MMVDGGYEPTHNWNTLNTPHKSDNFELQLEEWILEETQLGRCFDVTDLQWLKVPLPRSVRA